MNSSPLNRLLGSPANGRRNKPLIRFFSAAFFVAVLVSTVLVLVPTANATPGFEFTNYAPIGVSNRMAGYTFTVDSRMVLDQLGIYDRAGDGNPEVRQAGLWDSAGTLLATVTFGVGTSDNLVGNFRYKDVPTPVLLEPSETYTVAIFYTTSAGGVTRLASLTAAPGVNFGQNRLTNTGSGFKKPNASLATGYDPAFFGPNFNVEPVHALLQDPAFTFTNYNPIGVADRMAGYTFTVTQDKVLTQLGIFDRHKDGNPEVRQAGLWNNAGTLLSTVTFTVGTDATLVDNFRYMDVPSPITLTPGETYTVGIFYTTSAGGVTRLAATSSAPGVVFGQNRLTNPGGGFQKPNGSLATGYDPAFFGPNLRFAASPLAVHCGDGIIQTDHGEQCDGGSCCTDTCTLVVCDGSLACTAGVSCVCPTGDYLDEAGSACVACPANRYQDEVGGVGATSCKFCPNGTDSEAGADSCTACDPGTFNPFTAQACTACEDGIAPDPGATSCIACDDGFVASADRTECVGCPIGQYRNSAGACQSCQANRYNDVVGATSCTFCPKGTDSEAGADSCTACDPGTFNPFTAQACTACEDGIAPDPGATSCIACDDGFVASADRTECVGCPIGQYRNSA
ncbi:MAG: hypothetical protein ACI9MR_000707, partial [Myxococcota bacterium]